MKQKKILTPLILFMGLLIALSGFSQSADSILIKGQTVSKDNHPLPGVTVRVTNTDKVVISDISGEFELWTPIEGIVEFSCISEPYRINASSVGVPQENEVIKFEFDLKQPYSNYRTKKHKGRTIKVNPGRISDIILAYYDSDFKRITEKYYDYYTGQQIKIIFMVGGQIMPESFTLNNLDYNSLKDVAILRIIDSYDKIIFMIASNK